MALAVLLCFWAPVGALAQEAPSPQDASEDADDTLGGPEVEIDETEYTFTVSETPYEPLRVELSAGDLPPRPAANLGEVLTAVDGIEGVRRAVGAVEPVIRGLGSERVKVRVGSVSLYGACPGHMDPPVVYLPAHTLDEVGVSLGLTSVTLGPTTTGGTIAVSPDFERPAGAGSEAAGWVGGSWDSARQGWASTLGVHGGLDWVDAALSGEVRQLGDYESGDGTLVPATQDEAAGTLNLGFRPIDDHRLWHLLRYSHTADVSFPALPMDATGSDFWLYQGGYRVEGRDLLRRLEVSAGFSWIDHEMDNANKPNRMAMAASSVGETRSFGASVAADLRPEPLSLALGADFNLETRDATRSRRMLAMNRTAEDHIWPDARQGSFGPYGEVEVRLLDPLNLRVGGRFDLFWSDIGDPEGDSLGGLTVTEQYVANYGEAAREVAATEPVGAGNVQLTWLPTEGLTGYWGVGVSSRPAGITERYYAFAPAPGGYQVGNPTLAPEVKWETALGVVIDDDWYDISLAGYAYWLTDYILQTRLDVRDVNADGSDDVVRGFVNTDAYMAGGELVLTLRPTGFLQIPAGVAYTYGHNQADDRPLPEIAPLMGHVDARLDFGLTYAWWALLGIRMALEQDRVDDLFPENTTPGYVILRAGAGLDFWRQLHVELLADNLLDADYHEHLTRETLLAAGGLDAGDEVPLPGRQLTLSARWDF